MENIGKNQKGVVVRLSKDGSRFIYNDNISGDSWTMECTCCSCIKKHCPVRNDEYNVNGDCLLNK